MRSGARRGFLALALLCSALAAVAQPQSLPPKPAGPVADPNKPYVASPERPIAKIAVLAIYPSRQFKVFNQNAAGTSFGILPALFYGLDIDKKGAEYVAELNRRKLSMAPPLAQALHR